jgi:hypothetical protein
MSRVLVVYFSRTGFTETIAERVAPSGGFLLYTGQLRWREGAGRNGSDM